MQNWYYQQDGMAIGPIEESEMAEWIRSGQVDPTHYIRPEGSETWKSAGDYGQFWNPDPLANDNPTLPMSQSHEQIPVTALSSAPLQAPPLPEYSQDIPLAVAADQPSSPPVIGYESRRSMAQMVPDYFLRMCVSKGTIPVYASLDPAANPIQNLQPGDLFSLGELEKNRGVKRMRAVLLDGRTGYVPTDAIVFKIRRVKLQGATSMTADRSRYSQELSKLSAGTEVVLVDEVASAENDTMLEIRDPNGLRGYIPKGTLVNELAARSNSAGKDMLIGGGLCAVGLIITIGTYSAASSSPGGGTYLIFWGPVVYGGIQFLKGLFRLGESAPPTTLIEKLINQVIDEKLISREADLIKPPSPEIPEDQKKLIDDPITAGHWLMIIILFPIALIWGLINLSRGKKRSGKVLTIGSLVLILILTVIIVAGNS